MSAEPHPIAKLAFRLIRSDRGAVKLSDEDEHRLADALLAHDDDELFEAVRQLATVGALVMTKLAMANARETGDRILCIAELALDRLKLIDRGKAKDAEQVRALLAMRIAAPEPAKRAPVLGDSPPAGSVPVSSFGRRVIR